MARLPGAAYGDIEVACAEAEQAIVDGLQPWDTGATLANSLSSADVTPQQVRAADYDRLAAIKLTYDPRSIFRVNHNIPPAS